ALTRTAARGLGNESLVVAASRNRRLIAASRLAGVGGAGLAVVAGGVGLTERGVHVSTGDVVGRSAQHERQDEAGDARCSVHAVGGVGPGTASIHLVAVSQRRQSGERQIGRGVAGTGLAGLGVELVETRGEADV